MNKRNLILILLNLLIFFSGTYCFRAFGYSETYEQRTNPVNPFIFTTGIAYYTTNDQFNYNQFESYYHQVNLSKDVYYFFFISWGPVGNNDFNLTIELLDYPSTSINTVVYNGSLEDPAGIKFPENRAMFLFYLSKNCTCNVTIQHLASSMGVNVFFGIGFLELPQIRAGELITKDYFNLKYTSPINAFVNAAIINLTKGEYETVEESQSIWKIYYSKIEDYGYQLLNQTENKINTVPSGITTINETATYVIYSPLGNPILLEEHLEEESNDDDDNGGKEQFIFSYPIISLGLFIFIMVFYYIKKDRQKN